MFHAMQQPSTLHEPQSKLQFIEPDKVRTRFAPSPTGFFHIGSARTALFNYLFAKKYNGIFVLRIEDTDRERSKKEWEQDIQENMQWLGIDWQEGPNKPGPFAPYRQSERKQIYKKHLEQLLNEGKAYYCFCEQSELDAYRQSLISANKPPLYSGKCRDLPASQIKENIVNAKSYVIRFKMPAGKITFDDILRGPIATDSENFGDIVIAKNLDEPLYNFACVVDDFLMKITHIIRGEDHISNTPKQILLAQALGFTSPKFLHLPLILDQQRAKLSKRNPEIMTAVSEYKKQGFLPKALINFLALLGWNPGNQQEIFSLETLINEFSPEKIQKSGAVFNPQKLEWINGMYIRQISLGHLTLLCLPYLINRGLLQEISPKEYKITATDEKITFEYLCQIVGLYQERLKKLSEISELADFFFKGNLTYGAELLIWKQTTDKELKSVLDKLTKLLSKIKPLDWSKQEIEKIIMPAAGKLKDRGKMLWPMRVALSGQKASAGPFEIAEVLGKEKTLQRVKEAKEKL